MRDIRDQRMASLVASGAKQQKVVLVSEVLRNPSAHLRVVPVLFLPLVPCNSLTAQVLDFNTQQLVCSIDSSGDYVMSNDIVSACIAQVVPKLNTCT